MVDIDEYVNTGSDELNLVFVVCFRFSEFQFLGFNFKLYFVFEISMTASYQVGAMVHGKISKEYTDDFISGKCIWLEFLLEYKLKLS